MRDAKNGSGEGEPPPFFTTAADQSDAVVGSIIFRTSVILVAGKPLIAACSRMIHSSLAR
jgi:hypothetical protein